MADAGMPSLHEMWMGCLTIGGLFIGYFLKKRDKEIDSHGADIKVGILERAQLASKTKEEVSRLELKMTAEYATKDSLRLLFQETQSTNRDTAARLEKQIDETKAEVRTTNTKLDTMQNAIMTELAKKT